MEISIYIKEQIAYVLKEKFDYEIPVTDIHLEHPNNEKWGDYSSNVAMKIAKELKHSPTEIAEIVSYEMQNIPHLVEIGEDSYEMFKNVSFFEPGFINITLSEEFLLQKSLETNFSVQKPEEKTYTGYVRGQKILFEYTDPNPFKVFHIGHLMSNAIGESLSRIFEFSGAEVKRVNYQGDVGMHVAKSIWGILKKFELESITLVDLEQKSLSDRLEFLGKSYALGASAYKDDEAAKQEMKDLNYFVYIAGQERLVEEENWIPLVDYKQFLSDSPKFDYQQIKEIYFKGRKWSLDYFEQLYKRLGTNFEDYYFEGKVGEYGLKIVKDNLKKGVFIEDNGAIIFKGEDFGLHTRVFVNSFGLPTYEAKDLGLAPLKYESYKYDKSFIITANEINEYFKVVLKAMEQINPELAEKTVHIGHGVMRFKEGKMSSRTGDIISGDGLIEETKQAVFAQMAVSSDLNADQKEGTADKLAIGAIKYSVLKHGPGRDIIFDKESSLELTGNTGPYLQYTHARAHSVLDKAPEWDSDHLLSLYEYTQGTLVLSERELSVLRHMSKFYDIIDLSLRELSPNLVAEYLFELAQRFNAFYNDIPILSAETNHELNFRLHLVKQVKDMLKTGLWLLGIESPDSV